MNNLHRKWPNSIGCLFAFFILLTTSPALSAGTLYSDVTLPAKQSNPVARMLVAQTNATSEEHIQIDHSDHQHKPENPQTQHSQNVSVHEISMALMSVLSESKRYKVEIRPHNRKIPLFEFHQWYVKFFNALGQEIRPDSIGIGGGMLAHGHGLPSQPQVAEYQGSDGFRIDGVQFNMAGDWKFAVNFTIQNVPDRAVFDISFPQIGSGQNDQIAMYKDDAQTTHSGHKSEHSTHEHESKLLSWTDHEIHLLQRLSIDQGKLKKRAQGNRYISDKSAQLFGKKLFFDKNLSNGAEISCASCHNPEQYFTDGKATGSGIGQLSRNTLSIVGSVYQPWMYWDGRRDSLWSQALVPIEAADEMGSNRLSIARYLANTYSDEYKQVFGDLPSINFDEMPDNASPVGSESEKDEWRRLSKSQRNSINDIFVNAGRAIAAYESEITPSPGRFDEFVNAMSENNHQKASKALNLSEQRGLKLFISERTQCLNCHSSPMFSNYGFHNIGTSKSADNKTDFGRMLGLHAVALNEFNCDSTYANEANLSDCQHLKHAQHGDSGALRGAFRVPGLRGLSKTAPYMHDGRFTNLREVVSFYSEPQPQLLGTRNERPTFDPLSDQQVTDIVAFLLSLGDEIYPSDK